MPKLQEQIARALLQIDAVGFAPTQPVRFKSGLISPVYVDNRRLPYYPRQWQVIIEGFQAVIRKRQIQFEVIAGIAMGGVPHSAALGYVTKCPSIFIRKETKEHGTKKAVEGGDILNRRVLLIEDLVTTGGSCLAGVESLRDEGGIIGDALAIVSYEFPEAAVAFSKSGVKLHTLTNFTTIIHIARQMGKFAQAEALVIQDWLNDPYGWADRHKDR